MDSVEEIKQFFTGETDAVDLSPEQLAKYHELCQRIDAMEKIRDMIRAKLVKAMGPVDGKRTTITRGEYVVSVSKRQNTRFDYEKYVEDEIGEKAIQEIADLKKQVKDGFITSKYVKVSESTVFEVLKADETPEF